MYGCIAQATDCACSMHTCVRVRPCVIDSAPAPAGQPRARAAGNVACALHPCAPMSDDESREVVPLANPPIPAGEHPLQTSWSFWCVAAPLRLACVHA